MKKIAFAAVVATLIASTFAAANPVAYRTGGTVEYTGVKLAGESVWVPGIALMNHGERQVFTTDALLKGRSPEGSVTVVSGLDVFTPFKAVAWAHEQNPNVHYEALVSRQGRLVYSTGADRSWELSGN
jgi:hypothetical protein